MNSQEEKQLKKAINWISIGIGIDFIIILIVDTIFDLGLLNKL